MIQLNDCTFVSIFARKYLPNEIYSTKADVIYLIEYNKALNLRLSCAFIFQNKTKNKKRF